MASPAEGQRLARLRLDLLERLQGQRRVRLVVEPEHPAAGVVIAHEPDEGRDGAARGVRHQVGDRARRQPHPGSP